MSQSRKQRTMMDDIPVPTLEDRCVAPKRCRTAYNIFYQEERQRILASIPDKEGPPRVSKGRQTHGKISFQDLARTVSAAWKNLDDNEKQKYLEIARADKERYLREKREWQESVAELERVHSNECLTQRTTTHFPKYDKLKPVATDFSTENAFPESTLVPPSMQDLFGNASLPNAMHGAACFSEHRENYEHRGGSFYPAYKHSAYTPKEMRSLRQVSQQLGNDGVDLIISCFL